jgi:glycosyltransferase involved in cell wall biosynthesis
VTVTTSIVIPAYNESLRLANGYERLRPVLEELGVASTEVIVVDDGSSDDTLHAAHDVYGHLPERLIVQQPRNFGKGAAVRLGIALARGEHVIAADADMAIRPEYFPQILEALAHAPLAPGSRTSQGRINYWHYWAWSIASPTTPRSSSSPTNSVSQSARSPSNGTIYRVRQSK